MKITTIAELEKLLDGPASSFETATIKINPDGSLCTITSETETLKEIRRLVGKPLAEGEEPDYRQIFYCIQNILEGDVTDEIEEAPDEREGGRG